MHLPSSLLLPALLASSLAVGCASSDATNKAPVIDAFQGPATATIGASGNYEMTLTISCHDDDGTVAQAGLEIPGFPPGPSTAVGKSSFKDAQLSLQLDARAPKGPLQLTLVVTDDQGAKATSALTVTLQ